LSAAFNLSRPSGVVVTSVTEKSPAAQAGLKTGDVIISVAGQAVDDPNAFDYRFTTHPLGGKVDLGVVRSGKEIKVPVALETAPESPRDEMVIEGRSPFTGAKIANLSPALADELRLESSTEGVVVTDIADGSVAQSLGFQRGDVLMAVNGSKIGKTADLARLAKAGARLWRITIQRGGQQISAVFGG
jgi:S1-C subfamily serine protease